MSRAENRMKRAKILHMSALAGLMLVLASGCAGVHRARGVKTSGFLSDYSQFREGRRGEAQLLYVNPITDFRRYRAIYLEPIKVYPGEADSPLSKIRTEDLQKLLNYFDATIRRNLQNDYAFVTEPGPGVMRFRIALTDATGGRVMADTVSTVTPIGLAASALSSVAFGRGIGVGSAGVEFEALDAQTSERLAAAVDRRIGNKITGRLNKFSKWRAAKDSFDFWAQRLRGRLIDQLNTSKAER